jgi:hypothetical protein
MSKRKRRRVRGTGPRWDRYVRVRDDSCPVCTMRCFCGGELVIRPGLLRQCVECGCLYSTAMRHRGG